MTVIRLEPLGELNTIENEMSRLVATPSDRSPSVQNGGGGRRWIPALDLLETRDHYVLRADLPGVREDDVTVALKDHVLTIAGQRSALHDTHLGYYRRERALGAFSRSLRLPDGVNPDKLTARFDRGVLEVMIPKPEQNEARQVQIKLNSPGAIDVAEAIDAPVREGEPELALA